MGPPCRAATFAKADAQALQVLSPSAFQHFRRTLFPAPQSLLPDNREPITDNCGRAAISAFQRLQRFSLTPDFRPLTSGFTLIEIVVVTLIIATLAALLMTGASSVFDHAKKAQAKNDVTQLVTAINAFYTEYGAYPVAAQTGADSADYVGGNDANGAAVMDALCLPAANPTPAANPRTIKFLTVPVAKSTTTPKGGLGTTIRAWYDPWGSAYRIKIDNNYNGLLTNPYSDTDGSAGGTTLNQGVIAYSYGRNGGIGGGAAVSSGFSSELGTAGKFKGSSDILSWQ